jgi:hypothetical protein
LLGVVRFATNSVFFVNLSRSGTLIERTMKKCSEFGVAGYPRGHANLDDRMVDVQDIREFGHLEDQTT